MLATIYAPTTEYAVADEFAIAGSAWPPEILGNIDTLRHQLLDEMERITAGNVTTPLVLALSGACLRGLHFVLTGEGSLVEVTTWFLEASALLENAARIATPTATRIHCLTLPQTTSAAQEHRKKAA